MNNLTILLPTRNRAEFLKRALEFYSFNRLGAKIIVGDSSSDNQSKALIAEYTSRLDIVYLSYPFEADIVDKWIDMFGHAKSELILSISDDDLFFVEGIKDACKFLDNHKDYSASGGQSMLFTIDNDDIYGNISSWRCEKLQSVKLGTPELRIHEKLANYNASWYLVHRHAVLERFVEALKSKRDVIDLWLPELIESSFSAIYGKIRVQNRPFMYRQIHARRTASSTKNHPQNILEWLVSEGAKKRNEAFVDVVSDELTHVSSYDKAVAKQKVEQYFWCYVAYTFYCLYVPPKNVMSMAFSRYHVIKKLRKIRKKLHKFKITGMIHEMLNSKETVPYVELPLIKKLSYNRYLHEVEEFVREEHNYL